MQNTSKFNSISDLSKDLNTLLSGIEENKLTLDQLETANHIAREISERLIVLRHKAYERWVRPVNEMWVEKEVSEPLSIIDSSDKNEEPESDSASPFFQMSLIDAIEEASLQSDENLPSNEITDNLPPAEETIDQIIEEPIHLASDTLADTEISAPAAAEENETSHPLQGHNHLSSQQVPQSLSLADKHQLEKIEDLKRAITLNQRFQFSRELFKGNNQEYEVAIDRLNNSTREEALLMLRDLGTKFDWQEESSAAMDLYGLIERRYSSM
jgi:hypothetical protein